MSSVETKNEAGELLCVNQFSTFIMGAGGFGGKRSSPHAKVQQCMFNVLTVSVDWCMLFTPLNPSVAVCHIEIHACPRSGTHKFTSLLPRLSMARPTETSSFVADSLTAVITPFALPFVGLILRLSTVQGLMWAYRHISLLLVPPSIFALTLPLLIRTSSVVATTNNTCKL